MVANSMAMSNLAIVHSPALLMAPKHVIFKSSFIMIVKYQWVLSDTFTLNFFRKISLFSIVLFTVWLNLAVPLKTVKLAYLKEPSLW